MKVPGWLVCPQVRVGLQVGVVAACALEAYSGQEVGANSYFIVAVLTVVVVALRHRAPALLAFTAGPAMGYAGLALAPVVLLFTAGRCEPRRAVLVALVAWTVVSSALLSPWPPAEWISFDVAVRLAGGVLMRAVLIAGAVGLGQLLRVHQAQTVMVAQMVAGRAREQALVEHAARADERAGLAREMHDVVASQITVIAVQAGALRMVSGGDQRVQEVAEAIRVAAARTTRELREVLMALRGSAGDVAVPAPGERPDGRPGDHPGVGLGRVDPAGQPSRSAAQPPMRTAGAVGEVAGGAGTASTTASPLDVGHSSPLDVGHSSPVDEVCLAGLDQLWQSSRCRGELVVDVPAHVVVAAGLQRAGYRIVQEGLTNVVRYAPGAQVRVGVEVVSSAVVISVINGSALAEGVVPQPPKEQASQQRLDPTAPAEGVEALRGLSTGHGLQGVRERAEAVGGHASWGPVEGGGFQLVAVLPLPS